MSIFHYFVIISLLGLFTAQADELKPEDGKLGQVLNNLVSIHSPIQFKTQGYSIKFFGNVSNDHCAAALNCRSLVEPLIVVSELDFEGPIVSLYRLPKKHEWEIEKWEHLVIGKQGIYLKAVTYQDNQPDSTSSEEYYLLKTTWSSAEINVL
jgi:hypothetical protein